MLQLGRPGLLQALEAELKSRERENFTLWLQGVNPYWHWDWAYLQYIQEKLKQVTSGECKRLMLTLPPRHGKSSLVTIRYPVWRLERDPSLRVIVGAYNQSLSESFSRKARRIALSRFDLSTERATAGEWETTAGGGMRAVGVGTGVTGHGADLIILDDPVKNREEASSEVYRKRVYEWYTDDLYTRLEPDGAIVLIMCMTGDTPVLMADGTERLLRGIKIGDRVATYDNGRLATSTVRNHRSNGLDSVLIISTSSGKVVRANARHPFLVVADGELKWIRLRNLTTAHRIVTVKDSGGNGEGRPVPSMAAKNPLSAGDTAPHTTAKKCGLMDIGLRRLMQSIVGICALSSDTESPLLSMMQCLKRKVASALSANSPRGIMYERIGAGSCALTTATRPIQSEGFCAMTVTLPWGTPRQRRPHLPLPNTSDFTTEAIAKIELAGIEEVFDIQIERTENFIANGLVSHNTRWHEDDLAGRILNSEKATDWTVINLPAEAEENDLLGRTLGEALCPDRFDLEALADIKEVQGGFSYSALYQQHPLPDTGTMFEADWFGFVDGVPIQGRRARYWDKAASLRDTAAYTASVLILIARDGMVFVEDVTRGRWATGPRERVMKETAELDATRYGNTILIGIEQEPGSGGLDSARDSVRNLAKYPVVADRVTGSKDLRLQPFARQAEAGNVRLKRAPWNERFIAELCAIPAGKYRDQGDAAGGAYNLAVDMPEYIPPSMLVFEDRAEISPV